MRVVLTGGACTGKTTVIEELAKRGCKTVPEVARPVIDSYLKRNVLQKPRLNDIAVLQKEITLKQIELESKLDPTKEIIFFDRSGLDTIAYCQFYNVEIPEELTNYSRNAKFDKIFILDQIGEFQYDGIRYENPDDAKKIHDLIRGIYCQQGYSPIPVPVISAKDRANFILQNIGGKKLQ